MNGHIQKIPPPADTVPRVWTSLDLIKWTTDYFKKKGIESPRLEAEILLAEVLGCARIRLYVDFEKAVEAEKLARFKEFVKRRAEGREPIQYIVGHCQFIDLKLVVKPGVLIPRPETELLAAWALERAKAVTGERVRVLDLCTGSGCLGLYLAAKEPRADVVATDISAEALSIATINALALKVEARLTFVSGDLYAPLAPEFKSSFDILVSNPPYIDPALRSTLQPEVEKHEPVQALFADEAGLAVIRRLINAAAEWLKPGGWLGMEFGSGQAKSVEEIATGAGMFESIEIRVDDAKIPRMVLAKKKII